MNELKYIIFIPKGMNIFGARAVVFNGYFTHSHIAAGIIHGTDGKVTIHSAGFCSFTVDGRKGIKCHGRSESLNVESKEGDSDIIYTTLFQEHIFTDFNAYAGM